MVIRMFGINVLAIYETESYWNSTTTQESMCAQTMDKSEIKVKGLLKTDEPMARHTSWRAGGHARQYFEPADLDDLCHFLAALDPDEPVLMLGLGSNLLVRDGGFPGSVIALGKSFSRIEVNDSTATVFADAGAACAKVARASAKKGLKNAEFFAGIPGTMGGALAMNAGAFGGETWNIVRMVTTVDRSGTIHRRSPDEFQVSYRDVRLPAEEWFISVELQLENDPEGVAERSIKQLLDKRASSQPMGLPSCGSVFRNPPNDHAARLIESAGLKGKSIGKACVSDKHANFIINLGGASARDIESLIKHVQATVRENFSVDLQTEVKIIGNEA